MRSFVLVPLVLLIMILACTAPVMAAGVITINPGDSIQDAVNSVGSGGTVILNPGTYRQDGISIPGQVTIRANISYGYTAADTVIDGMNGRSPIFSIGHSANVTIDNLTFFNNSGAAYGGAIYSPFGGRIQSISSSVFTNCSAGFGGAISNVGNGIISSITSSTFTNCSASASGGAIYNVDNGTISSIVSSTFTNCSASDSGGVIFNSGGYPSSPVIQSISFCRFSGNSASYGSVIDSSTYTHPNLVNNWWGTNTPSRALFPGGVTYDPWLVLGVTSSQSSMSAGSTITVQANLTYTNRGTSTLGSVPDSVPVSWSFSGVSGSIHPASGTFHNGVSSATFSPTTAGSALVNATVDGQTISVPVMVTGVPLTGIGAITGTTQAGNTLSAGTVTPAGATYSLQWNESANSTGPFTPIAGATGSTYSLTSSDIGMFLIVNATGTGAYTGSVNSTPVGPVTAAASSGSGGSSSHHHISSGSGGSNDLGYTGAQPTIMGYQPVQTPAQAVTVHQGISSPAQVVVQGTAVQGMTQSRIEKPASPLPVMPVIIGAAAIVLVGGTFLVRRWWIRRQNPALFRKYD